MKKTLFFTTVFALLILLSTSTVFAGGPDDDSDYPWRSHQAPFEFQFGNMIDTHQQTKLLTKEKQLNKKKQLNKEKLQGFIYIHYTGEYTEDGIPIARKANCEIEECSVGWVIKGIPYTATLVNKGPRIWQIEPAGLPKEPGYTHFHWTGCPKKPHGLKLNNTYDGYLLKRVAVTTFYWEGGGSDNQGGSGGGCSSGGGDTGGCGGDGGGTGGCGGEGGDTGGCDGDEGGCSGGGDTGGCSGDEGGCSGGGDTGGCGGDGGGTGGCGGEGGDTGGCDGDEGGCSGGGDTGGCGGDGGDTGGCGGEGGDGGGSCSGGSGDSGGCGGDGGGCSGSGGSPGHGGRLVVEGLDPHSNIVTTWDGTWDGCGSDD